MAADVLYAALDDGQLIALSTDGADQQVLHAGKPGRGFVAVDESHVYFTNNTSRTVMRRPLVR